MDDKNMKSTENYLDNLLNSMNGRQSVSDDAADTPSKTDTSSQDDFLRKFEKELESDAYDEYISDFERDLENDAFSEKQTGIKDVQTPAPSESDATLEEVLSENEKNDSFKIPDEVPQQDDRAENNAAINELDSAMESFDDQLGDEEDDFILYVGRLVRTKGLDYLVKAMQDVDTKLIICGKGPDMERLKKKIERYGVSDKVELKGWVSEEEKDHYMSRCKLFVMPSLYESYGLAALEILSYGKPVICTNVDGLPMTVQDGGLYVKPKDPFDLADAINSALSNDPLRHKLGRNARAIAMKQNVTATVDVIEEVYRKVLDQ